MNKGLKIFVGIVVFLGFLSLVFLVTSRKKTTSPVVTKNTQVQKQTSPEAVATNETVKTENPSVAKPALPTSADRKATVNGEWQQCKNKTFDANKSLFWKIQITEAIPTGGTYAKGNLESDQAFPVHVIIKSDSPIKDKLNPFLVVGKTAFLRGNCTDVATDGSVVFQAF